MNKNKALQALKYLNTWADAGISEYSFSTEEYEVMTKRKETSFQILLELINKQS